MTKDQFIIESSMCNLEGLLANPEFASSRDNVKKSVERAEKLWAELEAKGIVTDNSE